jgi:hyperosmotically inducible protein
MRIISVLILACTLSLAAANVTDDAIYDQVRVRLAHDRDVGGGNIEVKVQKGVVQLTGTVKRDALRVKAEKLAKKVKGVTQVVNELKVATGGEIPAKAEK